MRTHRVPVTVTNDHYLKPLTGTASTPDPGVLPNQFTLVSKLRVKTGAATEAVIAFQGSTPQRSWLYVRRTDTQPGRLRFYISPDGTSASQLGQLVTTSPLVFDADETIALAMELNNGSGTQTMRAWAYTDGAWVAGLTATRASIVPWDSTQAVTVGLGGATDIGRIYYLELRTGLNPAAGTVLWRFDADDYPGTGTVYTDPRGQVWTVTSASAIAAIPSDTYVYPVARSVVRVP